MKKSLAENPTSSPPRPNVIAIVSENGIAREFWIDGIRLCSEGMSVSFDQEGNRTAHFGVKVGKMIWAVKDAEPVTAAGSPKNKKRVTTRPPRR